MKNKILFLAIFGCLFLALAKNAQAADWYVDNAVATSGNGQSWNTAWKNFSNIQWNSISAGDSLYISGGESSQTYDEVLAVGKSGLAGNTIKIKNGNDSTSPNGHNGEVIINGGKVRANGISAGNRNYLEISGLTIKDTLENGIYIQGSTGIEIYNCEFYQIGTSDDHYGINANYGGGHSFHDNIFDDYFGTYEGCGIIVGIGGSYSESIVDMNYINGLEGDGIVVGDNTIVSNNIVSNLLNITNHSDGIVSQGSNVIIKLNEISNCTQNIYIDSFNYGTGSISYCNNNAVFGNIVYATDAGQAEGVNGIVIHAEYDSGYSQGDPSIKNLKIYNNTIVDCNFSGIRVLNQRAGAINYIDIENNLLVNNGDYSRQILFDGGNPLINLTLDYNFYRNSSYGNPPDDEIAVWSDGTHKTLAQLRALSPAREIHGLAQQDPLFIDYARNDYQLNSDTSPVVDAGKDLGSIYNLDYYWIKRPQGLAWDIGAYEFTSGQINCILGDLDCQDGVTITDIQIAVNVFLGIETDEVKRTRANVDTSNPDITIADIQKVVNIFLNID